MFGRKWRIACRRLRRPLFTIVALASYLTAALGLPVLEPLTASEALGQLYPCQNHHCGCLNAEQCWTHCCCFTPEEKLAWALFGDGSVRAIDNSISMIVYDALATRAGHEVEAANY